MSKENPKQPPTESSIVTNANIGPPMAPSLKSAPKVKKTFPKVEEDFKSILEQRKKFINTSSNFATSTIEEKSIILKKSNIKLTV